MRTPWDRIEPQLRPEREAEEKAMLQTLREEHAANREREAQLRMRNKPEAEAVDLGNTSPSSPPHSHMQHIACFADTM